MGSHLARARVRGLDGFAQQVQPRDAVDVVPVVAAQVAVESKVRKRFIIF